MNNEEEIELKPTGEEGILLIKALCGLTRVVSNVNIPNTYLQIPNLPSTAVVEQTLCSAVILLNLLVAGNLPENVK